MHYSIWETPSDFTTRPSSRWYPRYSPSWSNACSQQIMSLPHNSSNQFPSLKVYGFLGTRIALDGTHGMTGLQSLTDHIVYQCSPFLYEIQCRTSYGIPSSHLILAITEFLWYPVRMLYFFQSRFSRPSDLELIVLLLYGISSVTVQHVYPVPALFFDLYHTIPYHSMMILSYHTILSWAFLSYYSEHTIHIMSLTV